MHRHAFKRMVARSKRIIIMRHNIFPVIQVQLMRLLLDNVKPCAYFCAVSMMDLQDHGELLSMTVEENKDCSITTDSVNKKRDIIKSLFCRFGKLRTILINIGRCKAHLWT